MHASGSLVTLALAMCRVAQQPSLFLAPTRYICGWHQSRGSRPSSWQLERLHKMKRGGPQERGEMTNDKRRNEKQLLKHLVVPNLKKEEDPFSQKLFMLLPSLSPDPKSIRPICTVCLE
eukprot:g1050.t1